ncbi:hypothetical protein FPY71_12365 [Aureimonas fodinaquatilis]|uniref:EamA family transporter n=1 Tax=Aureimonas fodinaquatilis TaxID=2565783 RepID=A0A5B0DRC7_9HYPH|nr:hypothetical protein [Aureimonas fodinaquatilis]KAA0969344.1 hypothetical protein FPY71_12365 [Aureimonas fodinaquatilis]
MTHWTLIFVAAAANVVLNLCLKQTGQSVNPESLKSIIISLLMSPWSWLAGISAVILLTAFVAAVRQYSLSLTYTAVTALAMVALTVVSVALRYESISTTRVAGLTFIIVGLALSARAD